MSGSIGRSTGSTCSSTQARCRAWWTIDSRKLRLEIGEEETSCSPCKAGVLTALCRRPGGPDPHRQGAGQRQEISRISVIRTSMHHWPRRTPAQEQLQHRLPPSSAHWPIAADDSNLPLDLIRQCHGKVLSRVGPDFVRLVIRVVDILLFEQRLRGRLPAAGPRRQVALSNLAGLLASSVSTAALRGRLAHDYRPRRIALLRTSTSSSAIDGILGVRSIA